MITNKMRLEKYDLTTAQIDLLNSITYTPENYGLLKTQIRKYLKNGYPIEVLCNNWDKILELGKDSSSLTANIIRYGEELGTQIFNKKCKDCTMTHDDYLQKYGEDDGLERLSKRGASLKNYIERHGEEEGIKKWNEYKKNRKASYEIGKQEKRYASRDLQWYQDKHGIDKGFEIWDTKRKNQAYKVSKQYYIDTYGDDWKEKLRVTKSRNLNYYINRYGLEEGTIRHKRHIENLIKNQSRSNVSKWAIECCDLIKNAIPDLYYYGDNELKWRVSPEYSEKMNQIIVKPDLFYNGKVIEFQGDVFHGNPSLFEMHEKVHPYKKDLTVKDLRDKDNLRLEYYISKGYQVLEIWEYDYNQNKEKVIEQCLTFLK